ncbi:MAG TPA: 1-deoxy-D-xylulose-5-phosphate reductoisomerase [Planctomycetota bacterium]|jgi:1-deoxy-D-xylulose-5-phosphate reductoisomerase|nr:1-deoxy-D-xylulose-5-phosphate reductoisomerase [Planctomycetota bacterium]HJM38981.1 1-deoxy-D-xylulose-5-phosphate reductoisomerase [Planctomycetota bacterium]|tara:strand:+ start:665 stop:1789 length:1125 start_codon:yes stop_codon:yes gene_type:complete
MNSSPRRLVVLGATGTVGVQTLEILTETGAPLRVVGLSAHQDATGLSNILANYPDAAGFLTNQESQHDSLLDFLLNSDRYDICLNAVVGAAGLPFSHAVLQAGKDLALANKESLVCGGALLMEIATRNNAQILPVDSEHSAIAQCLQGSPPNAIRKLYLTASGGALRDFSLAEMEKATPEQTLAHPNWNMGPRITVDSATMMNKALEIIEAQHLFGVSASSIEVLIHRQSVVHSMVEFVDGSILAQMGPPDMKFPIQWALSHPHRVDSPLQGFDIDLFKRLEFDSVDHQRFPAVQLGQKAAQMGGAAGAILNAADEVTVQAFLHHGLPFLEITRITDAVLKCIGDKPAQTLDQILEADSNARALASEYIGLAPT